MSGNSDKAYDEYADAARRRFAEQIVQPDNDSVLYHFLNWYSTLDSNYTCYGEDNHRNIAENAWRQARKRTLEKVIEFCEKKVERDPEHGGRYGGYGKFMDNRTGPEIAAWLKTML
jgi:hypothetical protein